MDRGRRERKGEGIEGQVDEQTGEKNSEIVGGRRVGYNKWNERRR